MSWRKTFLFAGLWVSVVSSVPSDPVQQFHGHRVFDINVDNEVHRIILDNLVEEHQLDVWRYPKSHDGTMSVRVRPEYVNKVLASLTKHGLHYKIKHRNVQDLIDQEQKSIAERHAKKATKSFDLEIYNSMGDINSFLWFLERQCPFCSINYIGHSSEGRKMDVFTVGTGELRPAIFIDGGFHGRDWISVATVIYFLNELVTNPSLAHLTAMVNWYFLPVANPDGYEYSRNSDRLWKKTRSKTYGCFGADPNRNFDYFWGGAGSSGLPCADIYRGTKPFSEVETQNIRDFILEKKNLTSYITFHSYGQNLMYPWGYDCLVAPTDEAELDRLANVVTRAIESVPNGNRTQYTVGSTACDHYPASGNSVDWAKGGAGVKYSYRVELPDEGRHGFFLPPEYIRPVSKEIIAGLQALAEDLHAKKTP